MSQQTEINHDPTNSADCIYLVSKNEELWSQIEPVLESVTQLDDLKKLPEIIKGFVELINNNECPKLENLESFIKDAAKDSELYQKLTDIVKFIATQALSKTS